MERQAISGIMQSEMTVPGTMAQTTETQAEIPNRMRLISVFFNTHKRMPRTIRTPEMTATATFALWQFMYIPVSALGHWNTHETVNSKIAANVIARLLKCFFILKTSFLVVHS
jgi:hypothetical protein